ncbi:hypothetical protein LuPra_04123 [Luteitalea pratensis]|uniref:Uncharacterized protein n=1 Tax=Luteitalea pratensis TaxID=1855912 RepID=A0A143PS00_LUTPR|nr:hypothetical protein LuPra_04123 [Luteitalea pratensis]
MPVGRARRAGPTAWDVPKKLDAYVLSCSHRPSTFAKATVDKSGRRSRMFRHADVRYASALVRRAARGTSPAATPHGFPPPGYTVSGTTYGLR